MFPYAARVRRGQGPNGQPVTYSGQCQCQCHKWGASPQTGTSYPIVIPKADEARVCAECANEMFEPWTALVDSWG